MKQYIIKPIEITQDTRLSFAEQDYVCLIFQLSQAEGVCSASNLWFSDYFGVSKQRASVVISTLAADKIIEVKLDRVGKRVVGRTLKIVDDGINKTLRGYQQSIDRGYQHLRKQGINKIAKEEIKEKIKRTVAISFDAAVGQFLNITTADYTRWGKAYPGIDLPAEVAKAGDWLIRKGETRSDYRLFLANWFKRCKPATAEPETGIDDIDQIEKICAEAGL